MPERELDMHDDFEIVDVVQDDSNTSKNDDADTAATNNEEQEEFEYFPLFSMGTSDATATNEEDQVEDKGSEDGRGRSETKLMKVSLREPSPEIINQERPKDYYFTQYTDEDHANFAKSAVGYMTILKESQMGPYTNWKKFRGRVIDLDKYNKEIDRSILREKILKKRRPGQKQRRAKKLAAERIQERELKAKEIKKMIKKQFHKRGGKKNKKKQVQAKAGATVKPKFRTE